ncbi:MAG: NTP transferase domain-containing protein, partial [Xanthomonadaceae bacterium]|nr:NTP transferase domain-containing protein [Xanthomonadaceae bacterium]
ASLGEYAGPLAGFITGLERCETPYLLTVPCDTPLFPADLAARMAEAMARENADFAVAAAREEDGQLRAQPVFCLMGVQMLESLVRFTQAGGRKIDAWTAQHKTVIVPFDRPGDEVHGFFNANTLAELHQLEARQP